MGKVFIKVVSWLARTFGAKSDSLTLEVNLEQRLTLKDLLQQLAEEHEQFGKMVFDNEQRFCGGILVVLNSRLIDVPHSWNVRLKDGDKVILLPPVYGG